MDKILKYKDILENIDFSFHWRIVVATILCIIGIVLILIGLSFLTEYSNPRDLIDVFLYILIGLLFISCIAIPITYYQDHNHYYEKIKTITKVLERQLKVADLKGVK